MKPGEQQWDHDLIADVFNARDRAHILNIPLSIRGIDDQWFWLDDSKQVYTVKVGIEYSRKTILWRGF